MVLWGYKTRHCYTLQLFGRHFSYLGFFIISSLSSRCQPRGLLAHICFDYLLCADDLRGPVAPAAHWVECQVARALVLPAGDALARGAPRAHDELAARVGVREHANVVALGLAVGQDLNLEKVDNVIINFIVFFISEP